MSFADKVRGRFSGELPVPEKPAETIWWTASEVVQRQDRSAVVDAVRKVCGSPHDHNPTPIDRSLLPTTILKIQPVWDDDEIPPRWHSCNTQSRNGKTKIVPPLDGSVSQVRWSHEVCACGGSRQMTDDNSGYTPVSGWFDKNRVRKDPTCPTRRAIYGEKPLPFIKLI